jgi:hypothetical protein
MSFVMHFIGQSPLMRFWHCTSVPLTEFAASRCYRCSSKNNNPCSMSATLLSSSSLISLLFNETIHQAIVVRHTALRSLATNSDPVNVPNNHYTDRCPLGVRTTHSPRFPAGSTHCAPAVQCCTCAPCSIRTRDTPTNDKNCCDAKTVQRLLCYARQDGGTEQWPESFLDFGICIAGTIRCLTFASYVVSKL